MCSASVAFLPDSGRHHNFAINRITNVRGGTGHPLACENSTREYFVRQFNEMVQQTSTVKGQWITTSLHGGHGLDILPVIILLRSRPIM